MFRPARFALITAASALLLPAVFAAGPQRPGKWETTVTMEMPGMSMPAHSTTTCITEKDLADPNKAVPSGTTGRGGESCKVTDYKVEGNHVTWAVKCDGNQPVKGTGDVTYSADSFTGSMKMNAAGQEISMKMSGKRLGDCDK